MRKKFIVVIVLAGIGVSALLATQFFGMGRMSTQDWPSEFQSNGERIYFTGTSSSGLSISPDGGGMHMRMMGGGCAACHGVDRSGGRLRPQFWITAPPLTSDALFDDHGAAEEDGHGDHERYTEETLARAIVLGLDPSGERLDDAMPRWSMFDGDLDELIAYLRSSTENSH